MTGTSLFLLGVVALSNIGFLAYLLLDRNRKMRPPADKPPENAPAEEPPPPAPDTPAPRSLVGKSKFNIDDELESRIDRLVDNAFDRNIRRIKLTMVGDVHLNDVEFGDEASATTAAPSENEIQNDNLPKPEQPVKNARMTPEQEMSAFEDVRIEDVEPDTVSAPSATGATMEDIEASISTAVDPDATPEDKANAGKVLEPLMDTNLMEGLMSYEEIYKGIQSCMTELLRENIADKQARKSDGKGKKTQSVKNPATEKHTSTFKISANIDDFDPADLLR